MTVDRLTCRELVELVTDYLENALPPEDRARFEAHIAGCHSCTSFLEQMRRTILLTGKLSEESLNGDSGDELLKIFRNWKKSNFESE